MLITMIKHMYSQDQTKGFGGLALVLWVIQHWNEAHSETTA